MAATSLRVRAVLSRLKARMTWRPLARPPMTSRRVESVFRGAIFAMRSAPARRQLDAASGGAHNVRISTMVSLCESATRDGPQAQPAAARQAAAWRALARPSLGHGRAADARDLVAPCGEPRRTGARWQASDTSRE